MTATFSVSDLIAKVREIAAERGDVTYCYEEACCYASGECSDGSIGCVFGQAFAALGIDPASFDDSPIPTIGHIIRRSRHAGEQLAWCERVQERQDAGYTWGEAVSIANAEYPND